DERQRTAGRHQLRVGRSALPAAADHRSVVRRSAVRELSPSGIARCRRAARLGAAVDAPPLRGARAEALALRSTARASAVGVARSLQASGADGRSAEAVALHCEALSLRDLLRAGPAVLRRPAGEKVGAPR